MGIKIINAKVIIIVLLAVILGLALFIVTLNGQTKSLIGENSDLSSNIKLLTAKMSGFGKKLQDAAAATKKQSAELEETRNKLTQERLKSTQLKEQIDKLSPEAQSAPAAPSVPEKT
ncbi:MAG: hypothetical protein HQ558_07335 [Candidatus Omnitrophica bacterium]|nr:hypothetical protein [Candidatus Omnitrophota bacterium]